MNPGNLFRGQVQKICMGKLNIGGKIIGDGSVWARRSRWPSPRKLEITYQVILILILMGVIILLIVIWVILLIVVWVPISIMVVLAWVATRLLWVAIDMPPGHRERTERTPLDVGVRLITGNVLGVAKMLGVSPRGFKCSVAYSALNRHGERVRVRWKITEIYVRVENLFVLCKNIRV